MPRDRNQIGDVRRTAQSKGNGKLPERQPIPPDRRSFNEDVDKNQQISLQGPVGSGLRCLNCEIAPPKT
jgi:hypothetical protein